MECSWDDDDDYGEVRAPVRPPPPSSSSAPMGLTTLLRASARSAELTAAFRSTPADAPPLPVINDVPFVHLPSVIEASSPPLEGDIQDANASLYRNFTGTVLLRTTEEKAATYQVRASCWPYSFPHPLVTTSVKLNVSHSKQYTLRQVVYTPFEIKDEDGATECVQNVFKFYDSLIAASAAGSPSTRFGIQIWRRFLSGQADRADHGDEAKVDEALPEAEGGEPQEASGRFQASSVPLEPKPDDWTAFDLHHWFAFHIAPLYQKGINEIWSDERMVPYWSLLVSPLLLRYFPLFVLQEMGHGRRALLKDKRLDEGETVCDMFLKGTKDPDTPRLSWTFMACAWPREQLVGWLGSWFEALPPDERSSWFLGTVLLDLMQHDLWLSLGHTAHVWNATNKSLLWHLGQSWRSNAEEWGLCKAKIIEKTFLQAQVVCNELLKDAPHLPAVHNTFDVQLNKVILGPLVEYLLARGGLVWLKTFYSDPKATNTAPHPYRQQLSSSSASANANEPRLVKSLVVSQPYFELVDVQLRWFFDFSAREKSGQPARQAPPAVPGPQVGSRPAALLALLAPQAPAPAPSPATAAFVPGGPHLIPLFGNEALYAKLDGSQKTALKAVQENSVVLISADGGAGKTFLFPYFNLMVERRVWVPFRPGDAGGADWTIASDAQIDALEKTPNYTPGQGAGQWVLRKATGICCAPFNTQKNKLISLVGQAFTAAELVKIFTVGNFADRFSRVEIFIMDEFSLESEWELLMVFKAASMLAGALGRLKRIVLMGDPSQLGPVQGGRPYIDLKRSGLLTCVHLTENHRVEANARMLTELPKLISRKDTSWIRKIALGDVPSNPYRECAEMMPIIIDDADTGNYNSPSSLQFKVLADRMKADPVNTQAIGHSLKLCLWVNRRMLSHLGFIPWDFVKDEKIGHCDYSASPLFVGEKVILKKKLPLKPSWTLLERHPHLKNKTLTNNTVFLVRAFTRALAVPPNESDVSSSLAMPGAAAWDQQSYVWVQEVDDALKDAQKAVSRGERKAWEAEDEDWRKWIPVPWRPGLLRVFKPGYMMTIHGFQGSQCKEAILFLEPTYDSLILNTGVGRPSNRLTFVATNSSRAKDGALYTRYQTAPTDPASLAKAGIALCASLLDKIVGRDPPEKLTVMDWWLYNRRMDLLNEEAKHAQGVVK